MSTTHQSQEALTRPNCRQPRSALTKRIIMLLLDLLHDYAMTVYTHLVCKSLAPTWYAEPWSQMMNMYLRVALGGNRASPRWMNDESCEVLAMSISPQSRTWDQRPPVCAIISSCFVCPWRNTEHAHVDLHTLGRNRIQPACVACKLNADGV